MREIKFRGKDLETGEWVYGSLFKSLEQYPAIAKPKPTADGKLFYCLTIVDADTVGQYTGLEDGNGRQIYEGDLILSGEMVWEVVYDSNIVSFALCTGYRKGITPLSEMIRSFDFDKTRSNKAAEIIGNRWDNPELLEDGE